MIQRCSWCENDELYIKYHDEEWGVPVHDDKKHFEFLFLEGAQAGLSWLIVLKKRESYRKAFDDFDPIKIANYSDKKINKLMENPNIIKNRNKINASINNAQKFLEIQDKFGSFDKYIWNFVDGKPIINSWIKISDLPAKTKLSEDISKDLKKRGFKYVGATIVYAHMQAIGIVNDHITSCFRYNQLVNLFNNNATE